MKSSDWSYPGAVDRLRDAAACAALLLLTAAIYGQVAGHAFTGLDVPGYVTHNPMVTRGLSFSGAYQALIALSNSNWHPLTWISHMLDVTLWGNWAGGHLLSSAALHALAALLLYALLVRLELARNAAWLVAALFAVHPLHVESVAWIAERKDVLCAVFWFATLLLYARYVERPTRSRYLWITLGVACAVMAKPMAVTLPATLLCLDVWPLRRWRVAGDPAVQWRDNWALLAEKLPWFAVVAVSVVLTLLAQATAMVDDFSAGERIAMVFGSYGAYLQRLLWPAPLYFFYRVENVISPSLTAFGLAALIAGSAFAWRLRQPRPWILAGWVWFVVTLIPVVGVVKVGLQAFADRYAYVPSVGLFWIVACEVVRLVERRPGLRLLAHLAGIAWIAALAALAHAQTGVWRDNETLFRHALQHDPQNYVAMTNLAAVLRDSGRFDEAQVYARASLPLSSASRHRCINQTILGDIAYRRRDYGAALEHYREAAAADPRYADTHFGLAATLVQIGDLPAAETAAREALRLRPEFAEAYNALGVIHHRRGRIAESIATLRQALAIDPNHLLARRNLVDRLEQIGDAKSAATERALLTGLVRARP